MDGSVLYVSSGDSGVGSISGSSNSAISAINEQTYGEYTMRATTPGWVDLSLFSYTSASDSPLSQSDQEFEEQKRLFEEIPPLLLEQYRGQYIASRNGQILDSDSDLDVLVERFFSRHGESPAYVTKIGGKTQEFIDSPF